MATLAGGEKRPRSCELCNTGAAVYCEADGAFLCWACDARVHSANFLVARHVRWVACAACHSLDPDRPLAGAGSPPVSSLCRSCDDGGDRSTSSSGLSSAASATLSSSCVSTAKSASPTPKEAISGASGGGTCRRRAEVSEAKAEEGVLVNWSRRLGGGRRWAKVAARVVRTCAGGMASLPSRVGLSAALWFAMKRCGGGQRAVRTCEAAALRKLEACSGVPAWVIVGAESRLARVARKLGSMEEGWGECSSS